jgi:hypothetical protein
MRRANPRTYRDSFRTRRRPPILHTLDPRRQHSAKRRLRRKKPRYKAAPFATPSLSWNNGSRTMKRQKSASRLKGNIACRAGRPSAIFQNANKNNNQKRQALPVMITPRLVWMPAPARDVDTKEAVAALINAAMPRKRGAVLGKVSSNLCVEFSSDVSNLTCQRGKLVYLAYCS